MVSVLRRYGVKNIFVGHPCGHCLKQYQMACELVFLNEATPSGDSAA